VSFSAARPSDADLAGAGLTPAAIEVVKQLDAHRSDLLAKLSGDRQFATDFARDPVAAAAAAGWITPTPNSSPIGGQFASVRFSVPFGPHGGLIPVGRPPGGMFLAPDAVERALLTEVLAQAQSSAAGWAAFRADPSVLVHQVAVTWDWRLLRGGSVAGASITQDLIDDLRVTLASSPTVGVVAPDQVPTTGVVIPMSEA